MSTPHLNADQAKKEAIVADVATALTTIWRTSDSHWELAWFALLMAACEKRGIHRLTWPSAEEVIEVAAKVFATAEIRPSLIGGLPGTTWLFVELRRLGYDCIDEDITSATDELLVNLLTDVRGALGFDIVSGVAGIGLYSLHAAGNGLADALIDAAFSAIDNLKVLGNNGAIWIPLDASTAASFDVGLAHGIAGVVSYLATHLLRRPNDSSARELLSSSLRSLLACYHPQEPAQFPYFAGVKWRPSRAAWCYGAPGIALALLRAATALKDRELWNTAVSIATKSSRHLDGTALLRDGSICHGDAGLVLLQRLFSKITGFSAVPNALGSSRARLIARYRPATTYGGFLSCHGNGDYFPDLTFLTGGLGIALALLQDESADSEWPEILGIHADTRPP